jgi:hypothetical protein
MYVNLELENANVHIQRASSAQPRARRDRAATTSRHRLFLVLLIVALVSVLVLQVAGSAYEGEVSPDAVDAGAVLRQDAPAADLVPTPDPRGNSSPYALEPMGLSGGGSLQLPK